MTTTNEQPAIKTWDATTIEPAPLIPADSFAFDRGESERRGRFIAVHSVASTSDPETTYTVVYHARTDAYYCDCKAAQHDRLCRHIRGLAYWLAYNAAFRAYAGCDDAELRVYERDMARRAQGTLCAYRGWTIDNDALADVVAERMRGRAA